MDIQKFFEKALECQKNEQPDLAITLYQEILTQDPGHLPSLYNIAALYGDKKDYLKAQAYYDQMIDLEPDFVRAYYNNAICCLQTKQIDKAQQLLEQAVILVPQYAAAQHMLGSILFKQQHWVKAKDHFILALAQDKHDAQVLNHLGMACLHLGELDEAEFYLNLAIEEMPYLAEAQYHLGVIHLKRGKYEAAESCFQGAVDRDPEHFGAWYNLGLLKKQQGFLKIADECLAKAQAIQPDSPYLAFLRAAVTHDPTPEHPPEGFVKDLFDRYAGYYDAQMAQGLDYQVPEHLHQIFEQTIHSPHEVFSTIIELGCGTGLTGQLFRPYAEHLIGIDLSVYMLEEARKKNIYDELKEADILETLSNTPAHSVDVFLAADVLGYIGVLDQLFEQVHQALKPKGYFIFSIESGEGTVALSERIRFTHSPAYIHELCGRLGFKIVGEQEVDLMKNRKGRVYAAHSVMD